MNNLYDLLTDEDEERARTRRINGIVAAIVTDNRDPDRLGRVKVRFPWLSEDAESDWAKIMSFMAGNERGGFFLPEVDDEVLVAFEHGDINYPYVLGALWNNEAPPPETNSDGNNNIRKITSRSGHEIILNDDNGSRQEKIEIHTAGGHSLVLDDSGGSEKVTIEDKSGNIIEIDSVKNEIKLKSSMKMVLESQMIEVKGQKIDIKGQMVTVNADALLTLKGGIVKIN